MNFENVKKTVCETADAAGKKVCDIANKTKIKFALANMQGDLDELYEELGRLYYSEISDGVENLAKRDAIIAKIDTLKADMEILKAEVGTFPKRGKICPVCGKNVPKSSAFCPYCGKEF
ncbi:MAG: zinc-ribbon domain-containing protein [Clostridia bacterium]|nr:zinc-ribbon domain-containing protein [Clostridia bacterium]